MPRPLKVFVTQLGFYDTVVAVPSQAAALKAWGTRMNLFAEGTARPADDAQAIEAALANPGVPLKRGIGTGEPFGLNPSLPRLPDEPTPARRDSQASPARGKAGRSYEKRAEAPPPLPPDRSELDAAEKALAEVERLWRDAEADFLKRRESLDAEEKQARSDHEKARRDAEAAQQRAHRRFEQAVARAGKRRVAP